MAEGAARSRAALASRSAGPPGAGHAAAHGAPVARLTARARDLWVRRKWWLIGAAILVLIEIVAGLAASTSAGHF